MAVGFRNRKVVAGTPTWVARGRSDINSNPGTPSAPENLANTAHTSSTLAFSWDAAVSPDPTNFPVLGYRFFVGGVQSGADIAAGTRTKSLTGLSADTDYSVQVLAFNARGPGALSAALVVSTDPIIVTGAPDIPDSATASYTSNTTATVSWVPATTGAAATGWEVFMDGVKVGATRASTARSASITGLTAGSSHVYGVRGVNASGNGPTRTALPNPLVQPTGTTPAGVIPFRVLIGITAPDSGPSRPLWGNVPSSQSYDTTAVRNYGDALTIIEGGVASRRIEHKRAYSGSFQTAEFNSGVNNVEDRDASLIPIVSFKHADVPGILAGTYDNSALADIRTAVKARRGTGKPAVWLSNQHEPSNAASTILSNWGKMHAYLSNYFAGWDSTSGGAKVAGSYVAANDVRDVMTWVSINNGFIFPSNTTLLNQTEPAIKHQMFAENGSIAMADIYEPISETGDWLVSGNGITTRAVIKDSLRRPSEKGQDFVDYMRQHAPGVLLGFGEIGTADGPEWTRTCQMSFDNRDVVVSLAYFDSGANSKWEWRLIPDAYPVTSQIDFKPNNTTYTNEVGGTIFTEERLVAFRQSLADSVSAANTGPL